MLVLVTYDIALTEPDGQKRLRRVAKLCADRGQRVQNSVFECLLDGGQWELLKRSLKSQIDPEKDSLRFYYLGNNWRRRVEHYGAKPSYDPQGPLIV